jgi:hypothetical protein
MICADTRLEVAFWLQPEVKSGHRNLSSTDGCSRAPCLLSKLEIKVAILKNVTGKGKMSTSSECVCVWVSKIQNT